MLRVVILLTVFFGAGGLGQGLARLVAPESHLVEIVSFLFLPLALILGFQAWLGLAVLILIPRFIVRLSRGAVASAKELRHGEIVPPGSAAFFPIASVIGLAAGIVVAWLSALYLPWIVALIYWTVGTAYGALLWALARSGYLPFPESDSNLPK